MTDTTTAWMQGGEGMLRDLFDEVGIKLRRDVTLQWQVGTAPNTRGERYTGQVKTIGLCEYSALDLKRGRVITVTDTQDDPVEVLHIMAHEMIHAAMGPDVGHGPEFEKACRLIGLEGRPRATRPGDDFKAYARAIIDVIGAYPHRAAKTRQPKQGNPMHKVVCVRNCSDDGKVPNWRASSKWCGTKDEPRALFCMLCGGPAQVAEWGITREERVLLNVALRK